MTQPDPTLVLDLPWVSLPDSFGDIPEFSGYGQICTPQDFAGTEVEFVDGHLGQAVELDGVNKYIELATSPNLDPRGGYTVEILFRPANATGTQMLYNKGIITGGIFVYIRLSGGASFDYIFDDGVTQIGGNLGLANWMPGNWVHVFAVKDNTVARGYIAGEEVHTNSNAAMGFCETNDNLWIGRDLRDIYPFAGEINSIRTWQRALGAAEIWQRTLHPERM